MRIRSLVVQPATLTILAVVTLLATILFALLAGTAGPRLASRPGAIHDRASAARRCPRADAAPVPAVAPAPTSPSQRVAEVPVEATVAVKPAERPARQPVCQPRCYRPCRRGLFGRR